MIGVVEKYLEAIALAIVAVGEFFEYLNDLCEESPPAPGLDTSALNDDLPELVLSYPLSQKTGELKPKSVSRWR